MIDNIAAASSPCESLASVCLKEGLVRTAGYFEKAFVRRAPDIPYGKRPGWTSPGCADVRQVRHAVERPRSPPPDSPSEHGHLAGSAVNLGNTGHRPWNMAVFMGLHRR